MGTLLASIGVPLLLNALTGKGLHADRNPPTKLLPVYVPPTPKSKSKSKGGAHFVTWKKPIGAGVKKKRSRKAKKGDGLLTSLLSFPQSQQRNKIPLVRQLI